MRRYLLACAMIACVGNASVTVVLAYKMQDARDVTLGPKIKCQMVENHPVCDLSAFDSFAG